MSHSRAQLEKFILEARAERDAAKADTLRAIEERDRMIVEVQHMQIKVREAREDVRTAHLATESFRKDWERERLTSNRLRERLKKKEQDEKAETSEAHAP